jgi:NAD-reducing hydrogenase large subunit
MDADRSRLNIFGLMESRPDIARAGISLRRIGQTVIESLAGKRIHPSLVVPGGVNEPLTAERRDGTLKLIPEALEIVLHTLNWFKSSLEDHRSEIATFANFPTMFMGLVNEEGNLELMDGALRFIDYKGNTVADHVDPKDYGDYLAESVEPWSFLKSPYYKPAGYPEGVYRAGPAARLNVCGGCGTRLADQEWAEFRSLERGPVLSSFHNHYARLIEILYCLETLRQTLNDPDILNPRVRASAQPNFGEGVGVVEAPRGTLFHHYRVDGHGLMTWANLIVATGNNNLAMNRGVLQTAKRFVHGAEISDGALNRVEAVIRSFDPCLSCSTHAIGMTPYPIQVLGPEGQVLREIR